jgi:hypothetical protein
MYNNCFAIQDDISDSICSLCTPSRASYSCPNKLKCRDHLSGGISGAIQAATNLRKLLYTGSICYRENKLSEILQSFLVVSELGNYIRYMFNGVSVCKSFYRIICGFNRNSFNKIIKTVSSGNNLVALNDSIVLPNDQELQVISFLDVFFEGSAGNADSAPENKRQYFMRYKWKELYENHYLPLCDVLTQTPVHYPLFTFIRANSRPYFKRHVSQNKSTFELCNIIHH